MTGKKYISIITVLVKTPKNSGEIMNHYDALVAAAVTNIDNASESSSVSLAAANTYVAIAQVQATLAVAEALRALVTKPKPYNLP